MCWHKLIVYPSIVYSRVQFSKRKEKFLLLTSLNDLGFWKDQLAFGIDWYRIVWNSNFMYLWKHWEVSVFCYLKRWAENIEILFFQSELKSLIFITPLNSDDLSSLTLGNELEKSHRSIFFLILLFAFWVCFLLLWQVCQSPLLIDYLFLTFLPFLLFPKNVLFLFLFSVIFYFSLFIFAFILFTLFHFKAFDIGIKRHFFPTVSCKPASLNITIKMILKTDTF